MKFLYATSITYPSRLANRIQVIHMARAFRKHLQGKFYLGGHTLDLPDDICDAACVVSGSTRSFILAFRYLILMRQLGVTHVYTREEKLLFFILLYNKIFFRLGFVSIYEAHFLQRKPTVFFRYSLKRVDVIVAVNKHIAGTLKKISGMHTRVIVAHDGVDLDAFVTQTTHTREQLGLPRDATIIMYTGHLYDWKGVETLAEAADIFDDTHEFVFVGGMADDIIFRTRQWNDKSNVTVLGYRPHDEVPAYLQLADVLVLPNTARDRRSRYFTSPLKLFEYMAAGKPIVASSVPSSREILDERNAVLVEPDDPVALADGIKKILRERALADRISKQALADVRRYTWDKRASYILETVSH